MTLIKSGLLIGALPIGYMLTSDWTGVMTAISLLMLPRIANARVLKLVR